MAQLLAERHRQFDPAIVQIFRLISDREGDSNEPVKLLEVNPDTSPSGIFPIAIGADPPSVPFPSIVIEVTPEEFEQIRINRLPLPDGWELAEPIYRSVAWVDADLESSFVRQAASNFEIY